MKSSLIKLSCSPIQKKYLFVFEDTVTLAISCIFALTKRNIILKSMNHRQKKMCKKDVSWVFAGLFVIRKLAVDIAETVDAWHTK